MARKLSYMHATLVRQRPDGRAAEVKSESWDEHDFVESGLTFDEVIEEYREQGFDVKLDLRWDEE